MIPPVLRPPARPATQPLPLGRSLLDPAITRTARHMTDAEPAPLHSSASFPSQRPPVLVRLDVSRPQRHRPNA